MSFWKKKQPIEPERIDPNSWCCANCCYFVIFSDTKRTACRRYPPKNTAFGTIGHPDVSENDYCGEFKKRTGK